METTQTTKVILPSKDADTSKKQENARPLSKKAQEAKIFIQNNPIPKEFLKS